MILVDSSVWIDRFADRTTLQTVAAHRFIAAEQSLLVGDVILTEVLQGTRDQRHLAAVARQLGRFDPLTIVDRTVATEAARFYHRLRGIGITVRKTIDTLIATRCILDGIPLLYADRDFDPFVRHLGLRSALDLFRSELMPYDFDLFVIGAGSGGVRAARVAAAHGAKVAVAEEYRVGGTCVIRGCVPKKLLVYGAHFAEDLKDARRFGWEVPECGFSWPTLRDNVLAEVDRLNAAYRTTLETHGVAIVDQRATVTGPHTVRLADGTERTAERILIAVGAHPAVPECEGHEHGITSNEAFHLDAIPRRVVIAGAGYIANEFAGIFNQLGAHVIIVNRSQDILRGYDLQIRDRLLQISMMKGLEFRFDAKLEGISKGDDGCLTVRMSNHEPAVADLVLFATGRVPNTRGLGLESAGVALDANGAVEVDADNRSTCASIYAVGDVTNRIQLTPVAIREGQAFADSVYGGKPCSVDYDCVPSAVFSHPPIGAVGMTESEARQKLGSVRVYSSDFRPMKNVLAGRNERALYKMVCDGETDRVVGIHLIGPDAPEIIQAAAICVKAGLTKAQFDATVALHPTMAEELVLLR